MRTRRFRQILCRRSASGSPTSELTHESRRALQLPLLEVKIAHPLEPGRWEAVIAPWTAASSIVLKLNAGYLQNAKGVTGENLGGRDAVEKLMR